MDRWRLAAAGALLCLGGNLQVANAEDRDENYYRKALDKWAVEVGKFDQRDKGRHTAQHVELLRGMLAEARSLLAQDELDDLEPVLRRIEVRGRYVDAVLTRMATEAKADAAEAKALEAERAAADLKKRAKEAKARYDELLKRGL